MEWSAGTLHNQPCFVGNQQIRETVENAHPKRDAPILDHKELIEICIYVQVEWKHQEEAKYKQSQRDHHLERHF